MVLLDRHRFQDAMAGLMLDLVGADATSVSMVCSGRSITIDSDMASLETFGEKKVRALKRRLELAGAAVQVGNALPLRISLTLGD
jgi:hypothetical protein